MKPAAAPHRLVLRALLAVVLVGLAGVGGAAPAAAPTRAAHAVTTPGAATAPQAAAASSTEKKPLALEDYPRWNRVDSVALSPDGVWMTFSYEPLDGDGTMYVRNLDGGTEHEVARGADPEFSDDSRVVAFMVEPPEDEGEESGEGDGSAAPEARVMDLASGDSWTVPDADSVELAPAGGFAAVKRRKADREAEHEGTDLVLRNLETGAVQALGNVAEFEFEDDGEWLAWTVDAADGAGNGVYLMELSSGTMGPLDSAAGRFSGPTWNDEGTALAVLRGETPEGKARRENVLLAFLEIGTGTSGDDAPAANGGARSGDGDDDRSGGDGSDDDAGAGARTSGAAGGGSPARGGPADDVRRFTYDPSEDPDFPEGMVLSEFASPEFSDDDGRIFAGVKQQKDAEDDAGNGNRGRNGDRRGGGEGTGDGGGGDEDAGADVDVWHWKDERVQSVQQVRAERDRRSTYGSVIHLDDGHFVQLEDEHLSADPVGDGAWAIGRDDEAYVYEISWGGSRADTYLIDTDTGERTLVVEALGRPMGASPDGRWYLYLKDERVTAWEIPTGEMIDITAISGVDFVDRGDDHPYEKPAYGVAGWSADGDSVVLEHDFDLWRISLAEREAENLTAGVGEERQIRFRHVDPEDAGGGFGFFGGGGDDDEGIDLTEPLLLSAYGEWTKKSGYWRLEPGGEPEPLVWEDASVGSLRKAEDAERMIFTRETFVEFPDWWVSDPSFADPRRVTDANPQQSEYAWSPGRVLVDYTDDRGNRLQATLGLPAGYEEGERYPMLVYFYETMSQRHHQYQPPRYDDRPHMSTYASNGYLVLQPDVVYTPGKPGESALDDVGSAVERVIELGYADPERICVQGHSWGGYQTSFLVTATDMFACVVTGAPVTNLVSFYNELYKSSGNPQQGITEVGQVRMGTSPWEDWELYRGQSPVHRVREITTPFLILHGTEDGAVDWHQGLEFFNAARRWDKEVILLSYPGEGHHLSRKENQVDFQIRMRQFFDHYMKGTPMPPWMAEGVPYLERGSGLRREDDESSGRPGSPDPRGSG